MDIAACSRCASRDLAPSTLADGLVPGGGEMLFWVCRRCGERGAPLLFDDPEAYAAFAASVGPDGREVPPPAQMPDAPAPVAHEAAPGWVEEVWAAPSGSGRARGTALFLGALGGVMLVVGGWNVLAGSADASSGSPVGIAVLLGSLALMGAAVAVLRIAARQWRGAA